MNAKDIAELLKIGGLYNCESIDVSGDKVKIKFYAPAGTRSQVLPKVSYNTQPQTTGIGQVQQIKKNDELDLENDYDEIALSQPELFEQLVLADQLAGRDHTVDAKG